jgi:4-aminobutyrate aminotransferase
VSTLLERHRNVMPSWLFLYYDEPMELVRGEGRRVWDGEGRCYLDFFGGILTTMTGYAVPEVVEAVREQAGKMLHSSTVYLIEPQIALAEEIAKLSGIPEPKVFFTNSGSEANDAALLLATAYRRSNQVLAIRHSYHGRSFSTMAITGTRSWSPSTLSPLNVSYVHGGYRLRSPFGHLPDDRFIGACVDDLRNVLEVSTAGDVACMIAEPIQGAGGFVTPPDGLFGQMKRVLDETGTLFIADEVQTGWGRTGEHFWGYQAHDLVPDMITFAKGLGNGLVIGGVVGRAEVMDCLQANSISTFGGNPLSTAGSLANLRFILDNDLQANAREQGGHLRRKLETLAARCEFVAEVRGRGLMQAFEFVHPGGVKPHPEVAARLMEEARAAGLLIGRGGLYGNVVRIAPPLTVTREEVDEGAEMLATAFAKIAAGVA